MKLLVEVPVWLLSTFEHIQYKFLIGFCVGGLIGIAYCKSSWPMPVLFLVSGVTTTAIYLALNREEDR